MIGNTAAAPAGFQEGLDVLGEQCQAALAPPAASATSRPVAAPRHHGVAGGRHGWPEQRRAHRQPGQQRQSPAPGPTLSQGTGTWNPAPPAGNVARKVQPARAGQPGQLPRRRWRRGAAEPNVAVSNTVGGSFTESLASVRLRQRHGLRSPTTWASAWWRRWQQRQRADRGAYRWRGSASTTARWRSSSRLTAPAPGPGSDQRQQPERGGASQRLRGGTRLGARPR